MTPTRPALMAMLGAGAVLTVAAAEFLHWRASQRYVAAGPRAGSEVLIVLGYPTRRGGGLHPLQRWRAEIAARSMDRRRDSRLVFTGAGRDGGLSEAEVMGGYARDRLGVPAERILLETEARSTWQNIELTLPMVEAFDTIKIASDPMQAARARRYLLELRPDLAARVRGAADYRFLDHWWLKIPTAAYEVSAALRRSVRPGGRSTDARSDRGWRRPDWPLSVTGAERDT